MSALFDLDFEDEILAQCLRDPDYIKGAIDLVEGHNFGTEHRGWMWEVSKDLWESSGELITRKLVQRRARADYKDEEERVAVLELVGKLFKLRPKAPRAALIELRDFSRFAQLQSGMEDAVRLLDKGNIDEAYKIIQSVTTADAKEAGSTIQISRWMEEFTDRLKHQKMIKDHPDLYPSIKTGIKALDRATDGGIRPTEMGIVAATTGKGKSIFSCHLGYHAIKQGCGVIDFRTEMSAAQVAMRYDSRWSTHLHSKFKGFEWDKDEIRAMGARLAKAKERFKGLLRIVSIPVTTATLPKMKAVVEELMPEMPNVKLLIFDSADHIREDTGYKDFRFETASVYWGIAGWMAEAELSAWCTAQLSSGAAERIGKSEDVSEAYDKARISDIFLTLNRPKRKSRATAKIEIGEDDDEEADAKRVEAVSTGVGGDLEAFLAKYRDGVADLPIPLQTDLKRMLITDRDDE